MANHRTGVAMERSTLEVGRGNMPVTAERVNDVNTASARAVHGALRDTPALTAPSAARDRLWMVVRDEVCTRGYVWARPMGSACERQIGGDDARHTELSAVMHWLTEHEGEARRLDPGQLMRRLRGVAVRGKRGSARAAQADAVHGMTHVPSDARLHFVDECVA